MTSTAKVEFLQRENKLLNIQHNHYKELCMILSERHVEMLKYVGQLKTMVEKLLTNCQKSDSDIASVLRTAFYASQHSAESNISDYTLNIQKLSDQIRSTNSNISDNDREFREQLLNTSFDLTHSRSIDITKLNVKSGLNHNNNIQSNNNNNNINNNNNNNNNSITSNGHLSEVLISKLSKNRSAAASSDHAYSECSQEFPSPRSATLSAASVNRQSIASAVAEYQAQHGEHNGDKDSAAGSEDFVTGVENDDDEDEEYISEDEGSINPATMMFVPKMQLDILDQSSLGNSKHKQASSNGNDSSMLQSDGSQVDLSKKARCDVCFKYFSKHYMQSHMRSHTGAKPFICTVPGCNRSFTQTSSRNAHVKKFHHNRRNRDLVLRNNLDTKHDDNLQPTNIAVKAELQELQEPLMTQHQQQQASESDEAFENDMPGSPSSDASGGEKQCQYYNCEMTFTNDEEYKKHLQQHQVLLNSLLSHNSDLFDGMQLHSDSTDKYQDVKMDSDSDSEPLISKVGRPAKTPATGNSKHRCNVCGKTFSYKMALKQHSLMHGAKNYRCAEKNCTYASYWKHNLGLHMKKHHHISSP